MRKTERALGNERLVFICLMFATMGRGGEGDVERRTV